MNRNPLVSVVVPFFNSERFLVEAIESVFAQTYDNWALVLVDDGSTDASTRIALEFAGQRPEKVRYLEQAQHQNRGAAAARNLGIKYANGEYLAFLDSDDVWLPHKLEQQVAILQDYPEVSMVYGASQIWYCWTGKREDEQRDYIPDLGVELDAVITPPTLLTLSLESRAPTPCPSNIMVRRTIVEEIGGFEENFRDAAQLFEDRVFLSKVYLKTPVFVASQCWDKYRQHSDSCVSVVNRSGHKYEAGLSYLRWLEEYLKANEVKDRNLWLALRRKRQRYRYPKLSPVLEKTQFRINRIKKLFSSKFRAETA